MSGISLKVFEATTQLKVKFADSLGNLKTILGTGFWVAIGEESFLVTNRHNLDATLKLGANTEFSPVEVEIRFRRMVGNEILQETEFFHVPEFMSYLRVHHSADVAVLCTPSIEDLKDEFCGLSTIPVEQVANAGFFIHSLRPMDAASFIGFPGFEGKPWWDEQWGFPIARTATISSVPAIPFTNSSITTTDVMLVSGFSFSGSSGSPVISHEKGIKVGNGLTGGNYTPPMLIGIMSGHWREEDPSQSPHLIRHSGLSYLTRSTAILELLQSFIAAE